MQKIFSYYSEIEGDVQAECRTFVLTDFEIHYGVRFSSIFHFPHFNLHKQFFMIFRFVVEKLKLQIIHVQAKLDANGFY